MPAASRVRLQFGFPLLVVSADEQDHLSLQHACQLHRAAGRRDARLSIRRIRPWVVVCDQILADGDWRDLLRDLQRRAGMAPLILSSYLADDRLWAEVLNLGGYDLLTKPFGATEVSRVVRLAAHRGE
jgi:DNA-binding response OmpR family regulator